MELSSVYENNKPSSCSAPDNTGRVTDYLSTAWHLSLDQPDTIIHLYKLQVPCISPELLPGLAGSLAVEGVTPPGGGPVVGGQVRAAVTSQLLCGRVLDHHHPGGTRAWHSHCTRVLYHIPIPWVNSSTQLLLEGEYTWFLKQLHSVCLLVAL